MKVLALPALAILAVVVWRVRRDAEHVKPLTARWVPPLPTGSDGRVIEWRRQGVL